MHVARVFGSVGLAVTVFVLQGCQTDDFVTRIEAASYDVGETLKRSELKTRAMLADAAQPFSGPDTTAGNQLRTGDRLAERVLKKAKRSGNKPLEAKLNEIALRLAQPIDGNNFVYQVYLLDDLRANAFTTGGGHLFVTTGLVRVLKSEGQMAMVLAHEMAHNVDAHVVKGEHTRAIANGANATSKQIFSESLGMPWVARSFGFMVKTGLNSYTRDQESAADARGLNFMVNAGYDPYEAPRTFENLMAAQKDQPELFNFFFGDHPTSQMRVWRLNNLIKAHYSKIELAGRTRSTPGYDLLAGRYWHAALEQ